MIILHFDLQPGFKYMNYFIYSSHTENHNTHDLQKFHQNDEVGIVQILHMYTKRFAQAGLLAVLEIMKP